MKNWVDSQLGTFAYNEEYEVWSKYFELDAFSVFTYDSFNEEETGTNRTKVELTIQGELLDAFPTNELINVARLTIDNHQSLLREGILALFNDMSGIKVVSKSWWHDSIDEIREGNVDILSDKRLITIPEDLNAFLSEPSISVQSQGYGYHKPCAEINFNNAQFDQEHGFGLLTDGISIVGIGRFGPDVFKSDDR